MAQIKEKYVTVYESILLRNPATNVVEMIIPSLYTMLLIIWSRKRTIQVHIIKLGC